MSGQRTFDSISGFIRSNIIGFIALFVALSGTALASLPGTNTVDSGDIINGEVQSPDIATGAVTSAKIGTGEVGPADLAGDSVNGAKIANGSVGAADVAPNSLGGGQVDEASLDPSVLQHRLASGCADGSAIRDVDAAGNVTCQGVGGSSGGPPTGPAGGDLAGNYPNPDIATNAVGTNEITTGGVGPSDIAADAVGPAAISTGAVRQDEIASNGVGSAEIADGAVNSLELGDNAIDGANIVNGSLTGDDISNTSSITGSDVDESSLDIGIGKTFHESADCDDVNHFGQTCASMSLTLPRSEHVALLGTGSWEVRKFDDPGNINAGERSNAAHMDCVLTADNSTVGSTTSFGEKQTSFAAAPVHSTDIQGVAGQYTQAGITSTLAAGSHKFGVDCTDEDGDMVMTDTRITAITLD